jgi:hypothetical protein
MRKSRTYQLESLERREMLAGDPIITEFMASNEDTILDGNGRASDWIEIYNPSRAAVDLSGWHLSDAPGNLTKWTFPDVSIEAGGYLLVFASGNNAPDAAGYLHTNFQLDANGDYLALVKPDGFTLTSEYEPEGFNFPPMREDVAYGVRQTATVTNFVGPGAPARTLIPSTTNGGSTLGTAWTGAAANEPFDASAWTSGNTGVGYGDFTPPIQIAGELFVDLDAAHPSAGTASWTNAGTLGNFVEVGNPTVVSIEGRAGVRFNSAAALDAYQSPIAAPAGLVGANPTRTIEAWVHNPTIADEETIVAWARRGGPAGTNMSFNYGGNVNFGAIGHWDAPDIGWGTVPPANQWNHVVYTYDGTTTRVYVNGVQTNMEVLGSGVINTFAGTKVTLAAQLEADGTTLNAGLRGTLTIGKMRIHDGVLAPDQVLNNYEQERELYPLPQPPEPAPLSAPPAHRYSFDNGTANDSIGTLHGTLMGGASIASGSVSFNGSAQFVNFPSNDIAAMSTVNGAVTLEAWGNYSASTGTWSRILDFGAVSGTVGQNYIFLTPRAGGTNGTRAAISETPGGVNREVLADGLTTATSAASHLVAVFDDVNDQLTLYINGVAVAGTTMNISLSTVGNAVAYLGRSLYSADPYLIGSIDEFRIYNYALTANQILGNFGAGANVINTNPPGAVEAPPIGTDLQSAMQGVNASAFVRTTFDVPDPLALSTLALAMRYDDGFVAYLNGVEVARRNAPAGQTWNSAATASREVGDAITPESINLSSFLDVLRPGTNVLAIHGLNASAGDGDFLVLPDLSATTITTHDVRYFTVPTPGTVNNDGAIDFVADTAFDVDRGFFDAPFDLTITSPTPGATIVYTTNGSEPTLINGTQVPPDSADAPSVAVVPISRTTPLRARAYKSGWVPTNVDTQTYIFLANVLTQNTATALAQGFPASWGPNIVDYEVDPDVTTNPAYSGTFLNDLKSIPTVSVVVDNNDFFGAANGVYANAQQRGDLWERPVSFEYFDPDTPGVTYQENGGVRAFGGVGRTPTRAKHSLRIAFREQYGAAKINLPIFADTEVEDHNQLLLKMNWNYSWYGDSGLGNQAADYLRDTYGRDTARDMGLPVAKSRSVHLYINGLYWGLYHVIERTDEQWAAETFGGEETDFDILKPPSESFSNVQMEIITGERTAWDQLMTLATQNLALSANYDAISQLVDIDQLIDYMLMVFHTGSRDAPTLLGTTTEPRNFFAVRNHGPGGDGKFRFLAWDVEWSLENPADDRVNVNYAGGHDNPAMLYSRLLVNPDFKLRVADRVRLHFFDGGALTTAASQARYLARATEIDRAIVGESARWGDFLRANPYTRNVEWVAERDRLVNQYLGTRTATVLNQLRTAGLYPSVDAPQFAIDGAAQYGGIVFNGAEFAISDPNAAAGQIFYTLDGSDPRIGGAASVSTVIINESVNNPLARVLVPKVANGGDLLGDTWRGGASNEPFNDDPTSSPWKAVVGGLGIGYDTTTSPADYNPLINFNVQSDMTTAPVNPSVFLRVPFTLTSEQIAAFDSLRLRLKYEDGFVAYINGVQVASAGASTPPAWNANAQFARNDTVAQSFADFNLTASPAALLRPGLNILAIQGLNRPITASETDFLLVPRLEGVGTADVSPTAIPYTDPVQLSETTLANARVKRGGIWSALTTSLYTVETPLRITELNYHPRNRSDAEIAAGFIDDDDFEFLEITNVHPANSINLAGLQFVEGITVALDEVTLEPGGYAVVVANRAAFEFRHGTSIPIAGVYGETVDQFRLNNAGERITLVDAGGGLIQTFRYQDSWHRASDGDGPSLVIVDANASTSTWDNATAWRASFETDGSPGEEDYLRGDLNVDNRVDLRDLAILQVNLGVTLGATRAQGDLNRDGAVTRADAAMLARNFGRSLGAAQQALTPPAAIISRERNRPAPMRLPPPTLNLVALPRRKIDPVASDEALSNSQQDETRSLTVRRGTVRRLMRFR